MTAGASIAALDPITRERWDTFVARHPRGTVYHLSAWARILGSAYRFKPMYLALHDSSGEIAGVMPLLYRNGPVSGSRLNSLPTVRWGGPLAHGREQELALIETACELVRSGTASRLTLRTTAGGYEADVADLSVRPAPPSWRVELPDDLETYRTRVKKRSNALFRDLKKAEGANLEVREGASESDLRRFYTLYLKGMRRHRALPRSYRQLRLARRLLPSGTFKVILVERDGHLLAGGIFHFFGDTVDHLYGASDHRHLDLRPNHALYREVIRMAIAGRFRYFDLGGSWPSSSLAVFKRHWDAEPVERFRFGYPAGGEAQRDRAVPGRARAAMDARLRLQNNARSVTARAWKLAPLAATRAAGALVYRYL